jgi:hypothetical protein
VAAPKSRFHLGGVLVPLDHRVKKIAIRLQLTCAIAAFAKCEFVVEVNAG